AFGHSRDGLTALSEYFEALTCNAHGMFDRLINVGAGRHHNGLRFPGWSRQFFAQKFGGIGFGHELGFKIQPATEAKVFVVLASKTINAAVLAAAIRVDCPVKGNIRSTCDTINDCLRFVIEDLALYALK